MSQISTEREYRKVVTLDTTSLCLPRITGKKGETEEIYILLYNNYYYYFIFQDYILLLN